MFGLILASVGFFWPLRVPAGTGWELRSPRVVASHLRGVTHAAGQFVAVGSFGTVITSADGQDWKVQYLEWGDTLIGVGYGNGLFVAVGHSVETHIKGVIWTSPDGRQWTRRAAEVPGALTRVAFGNGRFVAVGGSGWLTSGGVYAVSTDGIIWESKFQRYPNASDLKDVVFAHGRYLSTSSLGIQASTNGFDWASVGVARTEQLGLAVQGERVVAVSRLGQIHVSHDRGVSWTNSTPFTPVQVGEVTGSEHLFVAVGYGGLLITSPDGLAWVRRQSGTDATLEDSAYGSGKWVAVGSGGAILTSDDGEQWSVVAGAGLRMTDVAFGNGRFIAVGSTALRSTNGVDWIEIPGVSASAVCFGNGRFVAVGNRFLSSAGGIHWTTSPQIPAWPLARVTFGAGKFVATGGTDALNHFSSVCYTSVDGYSWTSHEVPQLGILDSLAYGNGRFLSFGVSYSAGTQSQDGERWTEGTAYELRPDPRRIAFIEGNGIAFGNGRFVATRRIQASPSFLPIGISFVDGHFLTFGGGLDVGMRRSSSIWASKDGLSWRDISFPGAGAPLAAAAGAGQVVLVGDGFILSRESADELLERTELRIQRLNGGLRMAWPTRVGHYYELQFSSDLLVWTSITPATRGTGQMVTHDWSETASPAYFRVRVLVL